MSPTKPKSASPATAKFGKTTVPGKDPSARSQATGSPRGSSGKGSTAAKPGKSTATPASASTNVKAAPATPGNPSGKPRLFASLGRATADPASAQAPTGKAGTARATGTATSPATTTGSTPKAGTTTKGTTITAGTTTSAATATPAPRNIAPRGPPAGKPTPGSHSASASTTPRPNPNASMGAKPTVTTAPTPAATANRPRKILVTGGAGFIGSHLVEGLVKEGHAVTVLDSLVAGRLEFLANVDHKITFVKGDASDPKTLSRVLPGIEEVWHLSANPEVRTGETNPTGHYRQNIEATFTLLEAMRDHRVRRLLFTSTSTVYGRAKRIPTPESYGPLAPISIYGACKLACEALIDSYAGTFGFDVVNFRFANVVGPRSTHGVTFDFVQKLRRDPSRLEILGDGTATKSYVSVRDTVAGMLHAARHAPRGAVHPDGTSEGSAHHFNIGSADAIPVTRIAEIVSQAMGLAPTFAYTAGARDGAGWKGDVKTMGLDTSALAKLGPGWAPADSSEAAIRIAAEDLVRSLGLTLPARAAKGGKGA